MRHQPLSFLSLGFGLSFFTLAAVAAEPSVPAGPSGLPEGVWKHDGTTGNASGVHPVGGREWGEAWFTPETPIPLDDTGIYLTYSTRSDRSRGEDAGAIYTKLHFTDDPERREQVSLNATVRPSDRWYMLYVDPGWQLDNKHYHTLIPPHGLYPNAGHEERFRLHVRVAGDSLLATLAHWDAKTESWVVLATEDGRSQLKASIAGDLEGQRAIRGISFQFPGNFPMVSHVRLEKAGP